jgi:hypothetical protein
MVRQASVRAAAAMPPIIAMVLAVSVVGLISPAHEAAAQSPCAARCKGDTTCLGKCAQARKTRQGNANPKPSSSAGDPTKEDWKSGIFDQTNKGGGGGGY